VSTVFGLTLWAISRTKRAREVVAAFDRRPQLTPLSVSRARQAPTSLFLTRPRPQARSALYGPPSYGLGEYGLDTLHGAPVLSPNRVE
jgi:hypothetical protein